MKLTWQEGRLAPHPQASEETPAGGDKFSAVQPINSSVAKVALACRAGRAFR